MASVGHVAVGMMAAQVHHEDVIPNWRSIAALSALSLLPDADVVRLAFGVDYADRRGHRGAIHLRARG